MPRPRCVAPGRFVVIVTCWRVLFIPGKGSMVVVSLVAGHPVEAEQIWGML
jgi:hypothetical protein